MTTPRDADAGITLMEMLVALAIFALVGLAAFSTLDTILQVRERTDGRLQTLARIDRALLVFGRDLAQSDPMGLRLEDNVLTATHPTGGSKQRYLLDARELRREIGPQQSEDLLVQALISGMAEVQFKVLDPDRVWRDSWPEPFTREAVAVEMTLRLEGGRTVRRLVALPQAVP